MRRKRAEDRGIREWHEASRCTLERRDFSQKTPSKWRQCPRVPLTKKHFSIRAIRGLASEAKKDNPKESRSSACLAQRPRRGDAPGTPLAELFDRPLALEHPPDTVKLWTPPRDHSTNLFFFWSKSWMELVEPRKRTTYGTFEPLSNGGLNETRSYFL